MELVDPDNAPEKGVKKYQMVSWGGMASMMSAMTFGTGGRCDDKDLAELMDTPASEVTEVAGKEAYEACGFDTSDM
jgi:hypothetical protein